VRILVTGASGFVGAQLVPALAASGHEVVAAVRDAARAPAGGDALELDLAESLPRGVLPPVDAVVHLAQANVPFPDGAHELFSVNVGSTQQLLEHARRTGAERFVYASSGSVYGLGEGPVSEDEPRRAGDYYAATKRAGELLVEAYAAQLSTVVLRPFTPYGPTQRGRLVPALVDRVRQGLPVMLNDGGRPRLTPIFVDDVVRVVCAAVELDGHHTVNVAGDEVASIRTLATLIGDAVGREPVFEQGGRAEGDLIADNRRMHELLAPGRLVPLEEGLRATALAGATA
jgi:UDP-glucose 4-epimerase